MIPQRGLPGPPRETYLTHLHPNAGYRGFRGRLRRQICIPTRATGGLTGDLGDKFVPQRGPPGPPRQTYLTHLRSDAGHLGLHSRLRMQRRLEGSLVGSPNLDFRPSGTPKSAPAGSTETLEDPLERRRDPPSNAKRSTDRRSAPNELFGSVIEIPGDLETLCFP